jgi:lipopolysaccharide/colanic/teichoic acid biosynthesis glycosyltransferase
LNIIKGEMSFVGPRPQLAEFLPDYTEFEMRRHEVRPGLTGPAQVNGRNNLPWNKRFKLDVEYVDNLSLAFDLRILALTLRALFSGSGEVTEDLEDFYDREK